MRPVESVSSDRDYRATHAEANRDVVFDHRHRVAVDRELLHTAAFAARRSNSRPTQSRIFGGTDHRLTRETFLDGFEDDAVRGAAKRSLDAAVQSGADNWNGADVWPEHSSEVLGLVATDQHWLADFTAGEGMNVHP